MPLLAMPVSFRNWTNYHVLVELTLQAKAEAVASFELAPDETRSVDLNEGTYFLGTAPKSAPNYLEKPNNFVVQKMEQYKPLVTILERGGSFLTARGADELAKYNKR